MKFKNFVMFFTLLATLTPNLAFSDDAVHHFLIHGIPDFFSSIGKTKHYLSPGKSEIVQGQTFTCLNQNQEDPSGKMKENVVYLNATGFENYVGNDIVICGTSGDIVARQKYEVEAAENMMYPPEKLKQSTCFIGKVNPTQMTSGSAVVYRSDLGSGGTYREKIFKNTNWNSSSTFQKSIEEAQSYCLSRQAHNECTCDTSRLETFDDIDGGLNSPGYQDAIENYKRTHAK